MVTGAYLPSVPLDFVAFTLGLDNAKEVPKPIFCFTLKVPYSYACRPIIRNVLLFDRIGADFNLGLHTISSAPCDYRQQILQAAMTTLWRVASSIRNYLDRAVQDHNVLFSPSKFDRLSFSCSYCYLQVSLTATVSR